MGRSTSGKAKGYKLHAIVTVGGRILAWRVAPSSRLSTRRHSPALSCAVTAAHVVGHDHQRVHPRRSLDGEETWTVLNSVGEKRYIDATIPPGTSGVQYRIRAKRGRDTSAANDPVRLHLGVEPQRGSHGLGMAA